MIKGATSCANTWTHRLGGNFGLDVPDLDLPSKRGRIVSKGGTTDWVHWQTGTAMLLPRLLAGRRQGPVFLIARKPARAAASGDLCPVTLRARLSYRRAARPGQAPAPPAGTGVSRSKTRFGMPSGEPSVTSSCTCGGLYRAMYS